MWGNWMIKRWIQRFTATSLWRRVQRPRSLQLAALFTVFLAMNIYDNSSMPSKQIIDSVRNRGELVVLTKDSSLTYSESKLAGPYGFEYDLAKSLAEYYNLKLKIRVFKTEAALIAAFEKGEGQIAASRINLRSGPSQRFEPLAFEYTPEAVVCRTRARVRNIEDLEDKVVAYNPLSISIDTIERIKGLNPMMRLKSAVAQERAGLLRTITSRNADCVIMELNEARSYGRYFSNLEIKFSLDNSVERGWLLQPEDKNLMSLVKYWQRSVSRSRELMAIRHRYMDHLDTIGSFEQRELFADIKNILPQFKMHFQKAASETGLPWELIAAVSYQESHWNPTATSFTGVRGLMQLTLQTAQHLGVHDRLDPEQSVRGGSKYLRKLLSQTPAHLHFKDRLSLALAAYNIGPGHLKDAQKLAMQMQLNPHRWSDLRKVLPLLSLEEYRDQLTFGLARGDEPVKFVDRVRTYYDIMAVQL